MRKIALIMCTFLTCQVYGVSGGSDSSIISLKGYEAGCGCRRGKEEVKPPVESKSGDCHCKNHKFKRTHKLKKR